MLLKVVEGIHVLWEFWGCSPLLLEFIPKQYYKLTKYLSITALSGTLASYLIFDRACLINILERKLGSNVKKIKVGIDMPVMVAVALGYTVIHKPTTSDHIIINRLSVYSGSLLLITLLRCTK